MDSRESKSPAPVKVAIVGGGCAGIAAAWHLSQLPGYEISVYEASWRLGGKGASSRDEFGRIQEHGLHVWLGFYENAFKMIRDCYDEVGRHKEWGPEATDPANRLPHRSFEDAFLQQPLIGVAGTDSRGNQTVWSGYLPPAKGLPGDPLDEHSNPFTVTNYLLRCVDLLKTLMVSVIDRPHVDVPGQPRPDGRSALDEALDEDASFDLLNAPNVVLERLGSRLRAGTLTAGAAVLQAAAILENILRGMSRQSLRGVTSTINFMTALSAQTRKQLADLVAIDEGLRWKTEIIDIVMAIAVGLYRDRVLFSRRGLDAINDLDYREWLRKHGATESALQSRFITGIYDLVFAYEGGNQRKPRLAAGVALRGALRMFFTYRGSMFWRMRSGMGDAVFAPLYKVMSHGRESPVQFHFLHELRSVKFNPVQKKNEKRFVTSLEFATPSEHLDIDEPGRPVLDKSGCWPDSPRLLLGRDVTSIDWSRTVPLEAGKDFDAVIFATGRETFAALMHESNAPASLVLDRRRQTVATGAAQVWLTKSLEEFGWFRGPAIVSALGLAFDTWADMTHTLPSERRWRRDNGQRGTEHDNSRSVAYFCGVLSDSDISRSPDGMKTRIQGSLDLLLDEQLRGLWPAAFGENASGEKSTAARFRVGDPHVQANISGSDRYSLSLPGTIRRRLSPLDRTVLNMTVAGDWTACGLDAGCVEAAVMSGMLAVNAITGDRPSLESIIGYDHP